MITKLTWNGTDLLSNYTNTSSTIQSKVRTGQLAWAGNYDFSTS
jgi:hypothetical protein